MHHSASLLFDSVLPAMLLLFSTCMWLLQVCLAWWKGMFIVVLSVHVTMVCPKLHCTRQLHLFGILLQEHIE